MSRKEAYSAAFLKRSNADWSWVRSWHEKHVGPLPIDNVALVESVQKFLFPEEGADGMLGPYTYRRMLLHDEVSDPKVDTPEESYILIGNVKVPVPGVHIDHSIDLNAMAMAAVKRNAGARWKGGDIYKGQAQGQAKYLATLHWDVATSAKRCASILANQGYGSTFGVDNPDKDGKVTVYQWMNPGLFYGYHAGNPANQLSAVSFDLSNAVALKYQSLYERECHKPRPIVAPVVGHRKGVQHLGIYPEQIVATFRILKAVGKHLNMPVTLLDKPELAGLSRWFQNTVNGDVWKRINSGTFRGVLTHQDIDRNKWDIRCFYEQLYYLSLTDSAFAKEFPEVCELFAHFSAQDKQAFLGAVDKTWSVK
jgi:hypothetical protein